ncbi:hypothetical protein [Mesorhizobium sp. M8A.F.Ca.ET.021.01.1.1]|uniref:hypothetical protein n=1 Tax=Mesorhizobium sp. M8A.F.Ca.ET.021.01.1.1 TaxID=2496757 RepID=UPI000FCAD374|nr:hypothetical protein [Mesorhizobium sp. M8A.F.Ca.ET.021.01.1.1]RUW56717.1 hypothetical protein EOA36_02720 [Mesorhizobium sp. M8A.F.Ca.ET.021.01.1.1]
MICTFSATVLLIISMVVQIFVIGSTGWVLAGAFAYHLLMVAAGYYVDYLMSVGYFLEKTNASD